ncbi:uncharacterized protein LOC135488573 [Lineus longissimus]|uniref:uncharacterized protein LOC135488573 n=1 Tax=Lineus longissimus TaxID=88925 RepID=UPI00315D5E45
MYADDNQLMDSFRCGDKEDGAQVLSHAEDCISDIGDWLMDNKLALNAPKTDMANFVSSRRTGSISSIVVDGQDIHESDCVKDLGVWLDKNMTMKKQVSSICRAASASLYNIGRVRKYLDQASAERLVCALVSSRLDCNNGILHGLHESTIAPLQRIQNWAARIVLRLRKSAHITPALRQLHWLPVRSRIEYKISLTAYKIYSGLAPQYFDGFLSAAPGRRETRYSGLDRVSVKRTRTRLGDRSLSSCAPVLWNALPGHVKACQNITSFKLQLKTWLFKKHFSE